MAGALTKMPESEGKNIQGLVHQAKGNFITALDMLSPDEDKSFCFEQFAALMRLCYKRDWPQLFDWVENLAAIGRERQKTFLLYCMKMIRENFVKNLNHPDIVYLNEKEKAFSDKFSPFINERNVFFFSEEFEKAYRDISQNGYSRLIFLDLTLKIVKFIKA
jgi:DNA polymerase-3 subunit delta'